MNSLPALGRDGKAMGELPPWDAAAAGRAEAGQEGQGGGVQLHIRVEHWQQWRNYALTWRATVDQSYRASLWLIEQKFTFGTLQFLQHWMDGLFSNGANWGGDVIVLLASAERLAARWCKGARQGLLSALDNKRGCAILLPNTRRRRRNKVVTWQLSTVGCFYYQSCSKRSKLHLLAFLRWNIMSACGRGSCRLRAPLCGLNTRFHLFVCARILHLQSETHVCI